MSSSSPGKWNKSKLLPRITDSNQSFCEDKRSDDFDIDSFDKLLDEITHDAISSNNKNNSQDENKYSKSKESSDFHLPPINCPLSMGSKLGMERQKKQNERYLHTWTLDTQNNAYGIGMRTTNILNEELRALVSGVAVPLPPMKTTRISSIVDPMESIPEEPSNTSICEETQIGSIIPTKSQQTNIESSQSLRPQSQSLSNRSTSQTKDVILSAFYDDAFNTELGSTGSSSTSQSSRWSKLSPFDCSIDPPQSSPTCVTTRPRAAKRGALSQQRKCSTIGNELSSSQQFSYSQGLQRSIRTTVGGNRGIINDSSWRSPRSSSSNSTYSSRFLSPRGMASRNARVRSWLKPNVTPPTTPQSNRSSVDDSYWRSMLSIPSAPSSVGSSFSAGTLAPIQEVSSSSENSSVHSPSSYTFNERSNKHAYKQTPTKTECARSYSSSSGDISLLESEKTDTKISLSSQSNNGNSTPIEPDIPPALNMNIHMCMSIVEDDAIEIPRKDAHENPSTEENEPEIAFTHIQEDTTPSRPNSKSLESSRSSQNTVEALIRSQSTTSTDTIETHLSEVSSSVMPYSATSDSELSDKEPCEENGRSIVVDNDNKSECFSRTPIIGEDCNALIPDALRENNTKEISKSEREEADTRLEQLETPNDEEYGSSPLSFVSWKLHSSPLCNSSLENDLHSAHSTEGICYHSANEDSFMTHIRNSPMFHENENADIINSQSINKTYIINTPPDPLSYIPSRSPQSYITTWRTLPVAPQRDSSLTSTFSICSHASKPMSHVSDGSTYTVSSPWKMISSEDEQSDESSPASPETYDRFVSNNNFSSGVLCHPFHNLFAIDSLFNPITTTPQTTKMEEGDTDEDHENEEGGGYNYENNKDEEDAQFPNHQLLHSPTSKSSKRSTSTFNVGSESDEKNYSGPEISLTPIILSRSISPASLEESPCTSCTYSLPCKTDRDNMRFFTTPDLTIKYVCPQQTMIPLIVSKNDCKSYISGSPSKGPSENTFKIDSTFPNASFHRLEGKVRLNMPVESKNDLNIPMTSKQKGAVQFINNSTATNATSGLTYYIQRPLAPPSLAACYFNYTPSSSKVSCNSKSIRACPILQMEGRAHGCSMFDNTHSIADVSFTYQNTQPFILTSNSITTNNDIPISINRQLFLLNKQLATSRSRRVVNIDSSKYPAIQTCILSPSENSNSEHEIPIKEYRIIKPSSKPYVSESVTSHDTNQEETHSSETQVTVMENSNYFIVTPTVNKSYVTSLSETPVTVLVSSESSRSRTPLYTAPSENDPLPSSVTKIVMASEASFIYPEIIDHPIEMEKIFLKSNLEVSPQKLILPSENSVRLFNDVPNRTQIIQSVVEICDTMGKDTSTRNIAEADIEIFDLTSLSNDESTKVCSECDVCTIGINCNANESKPIEGKQAIETHLILTNETACSILQIHNPPEIANSSSSGNTVNGQLAASETSQGLSTRSPSPVSSYSFDSEQTSNKSVMSIETETVDTCSISSEANEINETDLSVCSSRSCILSSANYSISPMGNGNSSDCVFSMEIVDYEDDQLLQQTTKPENKKPTCYIFGERSPRTNDRVGGLEECREYLTVSNYIEEFEIFPSGPLTIENIDTYHTNSCDVSNLYNMTHPSSPIRSYQSSDFDTSESSTVRVDDLEDEDEDDKDSVPSVIMGTPPKTRRTGLSLMLSITSDNSDFPHSPCASTEESNNLSLSPRHDYTDSDFENSIFSESGGNLNVLNDVCSFETTEWNNYIPILVEESLAEYNDPSRKNIADNLNCQVNTKLNSDLLENELSKQLQSKESTDQGIQRLDDKTKMSLTSQIITRVYSNDDHGYDCIETKLLTSSANEPGKINDIIYSSENVSVADISEKNISPSTSKSDKTCSSVPASGTLQKVTKKENAFINRELSSPSHKSIKSRNTFLDSNKSSKYSGRESSNKLIYNERTSNNDISSSSTSRLPFYDSHENLKLDVGSKMGNNLNNAYNLPGSNYFVAEKPNSSESVEFLAPRYSSYCSHTAVEFASKRNPDLFKNSAYARKDKRKTDAFNWTSNSSNKSTPPSKHAKRHHYSVMKSNEKFDLLQNPSPIVNVNCTTHHSTHSSGKSATNSIPHYNSFSNSCDYNAENKVFNQQTYIGRFSQNSLVHSNKTVKSSDSIHKNFTEERSQTHCSFNTLEKKKSNIRSMESFKGKSIVSEKSEPSKKQIETSKCKIPCTHSLSCQNGRTIILDEERTKSENVRVKNTVEPNYDNNDKRGNICNITAHSRASNSHINSTNEYIKHTGDREFQYLKKFSSQGQVFIDRNNYISSSYHSSQKSRTSKRRSSSALKHREGLKSFHNLGIDVPNELSYNECNFSDGRHVSSKLMDVTLNTCDDGKANEHAVDFLLPVRTLRTYSLEALAANSQLELSLLQLQMQAESSAKAAIMRDCGRGVVSLVSLPIPSSKSAQPTDSHVGSFRSSFDSDSSDTTNDEPKCQRRHTRPCVQVETKHSSKDFRSPLASSHAFDQNPREPDAVIGVGDANVEVVYRVWTDNMIPWPVGDVNSENVEHSQKISSHLEKDFVVPIPSKMLTVGVSDQWLEIKRDASLNVLIGIENHEYRPSSPPPHATRETKKSENCVTDFPMEKVSLVSSELPLSNIHDESYAGMPENTTVHDDRACADIRNSGVEISREAQKYIGPRYVRFSPNVTYIWGTDDNTDSETSLDNEDSISKMKFLCHVPSEKLISTRKLETKKLTSIMKSPSRSPRSTPTVTLYRSAAESDSSSFGLISIHKSSISSRSWCTLEDGVEEPCSDLSEEKYYPLPDFDDYPEHESQDVGTESFEGTKDSADTTTSFTDTFTGDSLSRYYRPMSSPTRHDHRSEIESFMSASESLGVTKAITRFPLAYGNHSHVDSTSIITSPRPLKRREKTRGNVNADWAEEEWMEATQSSQDRRSVFEEDSDEPTEEEEEEYKDSPLYDAFRSEKLYSGSSIAETPPSWRASISIADASLRAHRLASESPSPVQIPSMGEIRLPVTPSNPPYAVRNVLRSEPLPAGIDWRALQAVDLAATTSSRERRRQDRRQRRAERRRERDRQQLGVASRRPLSGGGSESGEGGGGVGQRRRRRKFARLRECFEGFGDALATVFTSCCD